MALFNCSECGKVISDKSTNCIHCGCPVSSEEKIICSECGNKIDKDATVCNYCGCPLDTVENQELVEENSVEENVDNSLESNDSEDLEENKKNSFGPVIWSVIVIFIIVILVIGMLFGNGLEGSLVGSTFKYEYYNDGTTITETYRFHGNGKATLDTHIDLPQMFNSFDRHYTEEVSYVIESNNTVTIITDVATTQYKYNRVTNCLISSSNSNIKICKY